MATAKQMEARKKFVAMVKAKRKTATPAAGGKKKIPPKPTGKSTY